MLSPLALRVISNPDILTSTSLRLFLRLVADLDLRSFRAFHSVRIQEEYRIGRFELIAAVRQMVDVGILEEGPRGSLPGVHEKLATYRIRPAYLLTSQDMEQHYREQQERKERETLAPTREWVYKERSPVVV